MARGTAELYDPSNGKWTMTANMCFGAGSSAPLLPSGDVRSYGNTLPSYASDFCNQTWNRTYGRNYGGISFGSLTLVGTGKVLLAGGRPKDGSATSSALLYHLSTNDWTLTGALNQFRGSHTITRLLNGQALAAGGQSTNVGKFSNVAGAELYTP